MALDTRQEPEANLLPGEGKRADTRRSNKRRGRFRAVGKFLITLGILTIGFVAYEYWGTAFLTQRAQNNLRQTVVSKGFVDYGATQDSRGAIKQPKLKLGGGLGYIKISRLGLDMVFVQGAGEDALRLGPGHYIETPLPGQGGNVAIAGHRTTYLHPFWALNEMRKGDLIILQTSAGVFQYKVIWVKVTSPTDIWVLKPTQKPSLTLTTCNPRFSARQRLDVRAEQVSGPGLNMPPPASVN
jgi:sortase A